MSKLDVDLDLVRKYNQPGPRYTSYPPATQFRDCTPDGAMRQKIRTELAAARPLSLYFHLPFCQSLCWFCGCNNVITTDQSQSASYLKYLAKELALVTPMLRAGRKVVQLHFGGGTPTFLLPNELRQLGEMIHSHFQFAADIEAGVEIDPRRLTRDQLTALREVGFNRASLGVQDHYLAVQKAIHRIQPYALTKGVVDWLREAGFNSINIDLIYGLPHQTAGSFERTLDETLMLKPDRLAVFNYAHVPWIRPAQKILKDSILPTPETKLKLLKLTIEKLTSAGYVYIGMDHFARADDELAVAQRQKTLQRNFQGYSTRGEADILGFGMSSISQSNDAYWQNLKELPEYYQTLNEGRLPLAKGYTLNAEDQIRRQTIMRLMCDLELDYSAMSERLGIDFVEHFAAEIDSLGDFESDGLVHLSPVGLTVTEVGRLLIRNIAMRFDAYLPASPARQYSRTI